MLRISPVHAAILLVSALAGCSSSPAAGSFVFEPVDEATRAATLASIASECDRIAGNGQDPPTQNQALAAYVRTLPGIELASVSDDGVVAVFRDAQPVILLNNDDPGAAAGAASGAVTGASTRVPFELPAGRQAFLLNGFGDDFPADPSGVIGQMLDSKAYSPTENEASVAALKGIGGQAVLHIRTHGGGGDVLDAKGNPVQDVDQNGKPLVNQGKPVDMRLYALWTTDAVGSPSAATDLAARRLVRMYEVTSPGLVDIRQWHLGVTAAFVQSYWGQLADGAYVHVSACSSAKDSAFVDAVTSKGSRMVYVGWDHPVVVADMDRLAQYAFDRLTGANLLDTERDPKEDPPQRPFDFSSVAALMQSRGLTKSNTRFGVSSMVAYADDADLAKYVLAPSIATVKPFDSTDDLGLYGLFGSDRSDATIQVGGDPCPINSWTDTEVHCALKRTSQGPVVVTVHDHDSNQVELASWNGNFSYAIESGVQPGLAQTWSLKLHLRGDVGDYRDQPGKPLVAHQKVVSMAKDSTATVFASGSLSDSECSVTWAPQPGIQLKLWGAPVVLASGTFLDLDGVVDKGDPAHLWFELAGWASPCYEMTESGDRSCGTNQQPTACGMPQPGVIGSGAAHPFQDLLSARLSAPASLSAGVIQGNQIGPVGVTCCGGEFNVSWSYSQQVTWDTMTPAAGTAPDPKQDVR